MHLAGTQRRAGELDIFKAQQEERFRDALVGDLPHGKPQAGARHPCHPISLVDPKLEEEVKLGKIMVINRVLSILCQLLQRRLFGVLDWH